MSLNLKEIDTYEFHRRLKESIEKDEILEDKEAVKLGGLHAFFKRAIHHIGLPDEMRDLDAWHLRVHCEELESVYRGDNRRLVVCLPPGTTKTLLISVILPTWVWLQDKGKSSWCFAGYDITKLLSSARQQRELISSSWFRARWGDCVTLNADAPPNKRKDTSDGASEFSTITGGSRFSTTPRGRMTNRHFGWLVVDDPLKAIDAYSPAELQIASTWMWGTAQTRTGDQTQFRQIVCAQRLAEGDLPGECLEKGWRSLVLPMRYDPAIPHASLDRDPRSKLGELLVPARYPEETVVELETALGRDASQAQLNQWPRPPGGRVFERDWIRVWTRLPKRGGILVDSWDLTGGGGEKSSQIARVADSRSYDVGQRWLLLGEDAFLIEEVRGRFARPEQIEQVCALATRPGPDGRTPRVVLLENKASGPAVQTELERMRSSGKINFRLEMVEPKGSKIARASLCVPDLQAGRVHIPANVPWQEDWRDEVSRFPSRPDDRVDTMGQVLTWPGRPIKTGKNALLDSLIQAAK